MTVEMPTPPTSSALLTHNDHDDHNDHDYLSVTIPDHMATMKLKIPRASLHLTHGLGGYIRRMRSRAPTGNTENNTNSLMPNPLN
jgi:hypothetical protein